MEWSFFIKAYY